MSKVRFAVGMLVASGGFGVAAEASADTVFFDYSAYAPAQNVDILGQTEYTYGADSMAPKSYLSPAAGASALTGSYSTTPSSPATDTYSNASVKTDSFEGPVFTTDSYANLKFMVGGVTYLGTANFVPNDGDVVLHSIDYQVSPVPEPAEWALLIAGAGLAGAALRRNRRQSSARA